MRIRRERAFAAALADGRLGPAIDQIGQFNIFRVFGAAQVDRAANQLRLQIALHDEVCIGGRTEVLRERHGDLFAVHVQLKLSEREARERRAAGDGNLAAAEPPRERINLCAVGRKTHIAVDLRDSQALVPDKHGKVRARDCGRARDVRLRERASDAHVHTRRARQEDVARETVQDAQVKIAVHREVLPAACAERGRAAESNVRVRACELAGYVNILRHINGHGFDARPAIGAGRDVRGPEPVAAPGELSDKRVSAGTAAGQQSALEGGRPGEKPGNVGVALRIQDVFRRRGLATGQFG